MAARISLDSFDEKVLKAEKPVLVDFYSDSCLACKKLSASLSELEEEYEGKVDVYKVNTIYDLDLVDKYEIMSNPTLLLFEGGAAKDRTVGAKNYTELKAWVDGLI